LGRVFTTRCLVIRDIPPQNTVLAFSGNPLPFNTLEARCAECSIRA
jgi:hypothetical protein